MSMIMIFGVAMVMRLIWIQIHNLNVLADDSILFEFVDLYLAVVQVKLIGKFDDVIISISQSTKCTEKHISGDAGKGFHVEGIHD
tara:strand:- start:255 stop:509 length:255 start_codon:yes stop_codon:yes gene_type:complete